ncbi:hypothetical protein Rruber_04258 [Rhodococcus ruber]|uniref:hypothetical protein n=1 Tax=Rhodococcus ruber TaxID=1830 RepID=UPI00315CD6A9
MSNNGGDLRKRLETIKSRWETSLNASLSAPAFTEASNIPLPETVEEKIEYLESHLRATLADLSDPATGLINASLSPTSTDQIIELAREARTLTLLRMSCNEAAGAGIVLISIGTGIHPAAGVVGFLIGVELLLESCG